MKKISQLNVRILRIHHEFEIVRNELRECYSLITKRPIAPDLTISMKIASAMKLRSAYKAVLDEKQLLKDLFE